MTTEQLNELLSLARAARELSEALSVEGNVTVADRLIDSANITDLNTHLGSILDKIAALLASS